jgi:hypothetical protein
MVKFGVPFEVRTAFLNRPTINVNTSFKGLKKFKNASGMKLFTDYIRYVSMKGKILLLTGNVSYILHHFTGNI